MSAMQQAQTLDARIREARAQERAAIQAARQAEAEESRRNERELLSLAPLFRFRDPK